MSMTYTVAERFTQAWDALMPQDRGDLLLAHVEGRSDLILTGRYIYVDSNQLVVFPEDRKEVTPLWERSSPAERSGWVERAFRSRAELVACDPFVINEAHLKAVNAAIASMAHLVAAVPSEQCIRVATILSELDERETKAEVACKKSRHGIISCEAMCQEAQAVSKEMRTKALKRAAASAKDMRCIVEAFQQRMVDVCDEMRGVYIALAVADLARTNLSTPRRPPAEEDFRANDEATDE